MALRESQEAFAEAAKITPVAPRLLKNGQRITVSQNWHGGVGIGGTGESPKTGSITHPMTKDCDSVTIRFDDEDKDQQLTSQELMAMGYECPNMDPPRGGDWASTVLKFSCQSKEGLTELNRTPWDYYCELVDNQFPFDTVTEADIQKKKNQSPIYCLLRPQNPQSPYTTISQYLIQEEITSCKIDNNLVIAWKKFVYQDLVLIHRKFYGLPAPEVSWYGATQAEANARDAHYTKLAQERLDESVSVIKQAHDYFVKGASEMLICGGQSVSIFLNPAKPQVTCVATPSFSQELRQMAGGEVGIREFEIDGVDNTKPLESILQRLARQMYPGTNFAVSNHPSHRPPPPPEESPPPDTDQNVSGAASHQWLIAFDKDGRPYWYNPGMTDSKGNPIRTWTFPGLALDPDTHSAPATLRQPAVDPIRDENRRSHNRSGPSGPSEIATKVSVSVSSPASILAPVMQQLDSRFESAYPRKVNYKLGRPSLALWLKKASPGLTITAKPSLPWDKMRSLLQRHDYAAFAVASQGVVATLSQTITGLDGDQCKSILKNLPRMGKAGFFDAVRENIVKGVEVHISGAYGYEQNRDAPPTQTRRGGRNTVFGKKAEQTQSESMGSYVRRASQASDVPVLVRIEMDMADSAPSSESPGIQRFCSLPSGCEQCGVIPRSVFVMHMDAGSIVDPHCIDGLSNRTIVVMGGSVVVLLWTFSACKSSPQFASEGYREDLDIFSECGACRELLDVDGYPTVLKISEGNAVVIRSGCRVAWIASEESVLCDFGWDDLKDRERFAQVVNRHKEKGQFNSTLSHHARVYMNDCLEHRDACLPEEYCCQADTLRLEFLPGFFAEVLLGITTSTQRIMSRRLLKYLFGNQDEDYYKLVEYGLRNNPENTFIPACQLATQTLTAFCANPSCNLRGEAILNLRGISFTKRHTPVLPLDESIAVAVNCHDGRESDGVNSSDREYLVLHLERPSFDASGASDAAVSDTRMEPMPSSSKRPRSS